MRNGCQTRSLPCQCIYDLIQPTNRFGQKLKEQVERRLVRGENEEEEPEKNEELMDEIMDELREEKLYFDSDEKFRKHQKKQLKKQKKAAVVVEEEEEEVKLPKKHKKIAK